MSRIKSKNTTIELKMKQMLLDLDCDYEMHPQMYGSPDFVLKRKNVIIFCDGDFWHGYKYNEKKKLRKKYWKEKIKTNMKRDLHVSRKLRREGWSVLRFWEHDIQKNPEKCIRKILRKTGRSNYTEKSINYR